MSFTRLEEFLLEKNLLFWSKLLCSTMNVSVIKSKVPPKLKECVALYVET